MAAPAASREQDTQIPTPDQILAGYERAVRVPSSQDAADLWCWHVVQAAIDSLGPESGPTFLRIARHRALYGSLFGCRIGTVTAGGAPACAKGRVRAEREMLACMEAAYEKWERTLLEVIENQSRGF